MTVSHKSTSSEGIRRHHAVLPDDEVTVHEGIPVTTVPRTIFDLAAGLSIDRLESAIRQAEYRQLRDRLSLVDMVNRYRGRRGVRRDWIVVGRRRFQVDCHWVGTGQVIELDSWQAHGTRSAFKEDRTRDRILRTAGYAVTRISWAQLDDEPEAVARDLRALLYKRS